MKIILLASVHRLNHYYADLMSFFLKDPENTGQIIDFSKLNRITLRSLLTGTNSASRRLLALKNLVKKEDPDLLVIASSKEQFDLRKVREFYHKKILLYDTEGPNFPGYSHTDWIPLADRVLTASLFIEQKYRGEFPQVRYLPHSVNPERFSLETGTPRNLSTLAFAGRPSPHRVRIFSALSAYDLKLYGRKWTCKDIPEEVRKHAHGNFDVYDRDLKHLLNRAGLFINVQQDHYLPMQTLVNMSVTMAMACGCCVIAEYVREIDSAFRIGEEILVWRTPEELKKQIDFCLANPGKSREIAEAGRQRCIRDHGMERRAREILRLVKED